MLRPLKPEVSSVAAGDRDIRARNEPVLSLIDLSTGSRAGSFKYGDAHFSRDGNRVALVAEDTLEVYDLPLSKPWRRIIAYGALAAGITGLLLCWRKWRWSRSKQTPSVSAI